MIVEWGAEVYDGGSGVDGGRGTGRARFPLKLR